MTAPLHWTFKVLLMLLISMWLDSDWSYTIRTYMYSLEWLVGDPTISETNFQPLIWWFLKLIFTTLLPGYPGAGVVVDRCIIRSILPNNMWHNQQEWVEASLIVSGNELHVGNI